MFELAQAIPNPGGYRDVFVSIAQGYKALVWQEKTVVCVILAHREYDGEQLSLP